MTVSGAPHLHFDFSALSPAEVYKLVTGVVVPRPIAWVSTLGTGGHVNLAPYSFFGLMGSDPAVVAFGPGDRADGTPKDTALNIASGGEFTVNLVSEELAPLMNATATDFPYVLGEAKTLGVSLAPGVRVRVPRVAQSPASLECREVETVVIGRTRVILGEVLGLHLRADAMQNLERHHVNTAALDLVGRMGGRGTYTRTRDTFTIDRMTYAAWQERQREADVQTQD